jgi:hypothetical protein
MRESPLRVVIAGGECEVSEQCLWWPPSKVASRWLTPWLAARDARASSSTPRVLPTGGISRGSIAGGAAGRPRAALAR